MKTKSKRFLNLVTLCLALLGTTLLMGRPVKAEEMTPYTSTVSDNSEREGSDEKYWWNKGYDHGYEEGKKSENRKELDRRTFNNFPEGIPDDEKVEYMDGYDGGHETGWREEHLLETLLEDVLGFLRNIFSFWFSGEEASQ
ncbi:TPA: hypothetical protein ACQOEN_000401 [Streptococcus pyogenes]